MPRFSSVDLDRIMASAAPGAPEACGLLLAGAGTIGCLPTRNVAPDPAIAFEVDPAALIAAHRHHRRATGPALLGVYHTHPTGGCWPSARDAAQAAADGMLWLIATRQAARLWRAVPAGEVHGRFYPVPFAVKIGAKTREGLLEVAAEDVGGAGAARLEEPRA